MEELCIKRKYTKGHPRKTPMRLRLAVAEGLRPLLPSEVPPVVMAVSEAALNRFLFRTHASDKSPFCWEWVGAKTRCGYGSAGMNGKTNRAHRVSYMYFNGPIPEGLSVMHSCDNPACVKPEHLSVGTPKENKLDSMRKGRTRRFKPTHCPRGHEYTPENSYFYTDKNGFPERDCRTCSIAKARRRRAAKKVICDHMNKKRILDNHVRQY